MRGTPYQAPNLKGTDVNVTLDVEFMEAVLGAKKIVSFNRQNPCETCNTTRCKPGTEPDTCNNCGGRGYLSVR